MHCNEFHKRSRLFAQNMCCVGQLFGVDDEMPASAWQLRENSPSLARCGAGLFLKKKLKNSCKISHTELFCGDHGCADDGCGQRGRCKSWD
jgi:hypothetical protein